MAKSSRLTIGLIESTRATSEEVWLSDDDGSRNSGRLALRITNSGRRRFYFRFFDGGKRKVIPLGPYARTQTPGCLTLEEAREVVFRYSHAMRTAESPTLRDALLARLLPPDQSLASEVSVPRTKATPRNLPESGTVLELCDAYVAHLRQRKAQSTQTAAILVRNHVKPTQWANVPASQLRPDQATEMIRMLVTAGHVTTAKHLRQLLHAAYNLARHGKNDPMTPASFKDFGISSNPIAETARMTGAIGERRRPAATKLELGHIWLQLQDHKYDESAAVRAVRLNFLLGGQRCLQLLRCELAHVNLESGVLLLHDGKGRRRTPRQHLLPLTSGARREVMALRQMALDLGNPFLIPGGVKSRPLTAGPVSQVLTDVSRRLCSAKKLSEPFCYANIRSTIETQMGELDIPPHIRAEIQSHDMGGVQKKNYDRGHYLKQKLIALERWQQWLSEAAELAKVDLNR